VVKLRKIFLWGLVIISIITVFSLLAITGCRAQPAAPAGETDTATADTVPNDTLFGVVLHISSPFADTIGRGAKNAAKDYGATNLEVVVPSQMEATEQIALFDAMVSKGAKGILTVAAAAGSWTVPINNAVDNGVIVVTGNVGDSESKQSIYSGISGYEDGLTLGKAIMEHPDTPKEGKVVLGIPIPGLPVLEGRIKGLLEVIGENPDYEIIGPLDCGQSPEATYSWVESNFTANPDMVMLIGSSFLEPGAADQFKRKTAGADFFVAGYDLEPNQLEGIKDGTIDITIGQGPYLQGYLPMAAIFEHLLKGNPLAQGWANPGQEVVTKENIEFFIERENNPDIEYEFYKEVIDKNFTPIWEKVTPWSEYIP
jgi:ABC-type sugar transport system substrate-binding protein